MSRRPAPPNPLMAQVRQILAQQEKAERKAKKPEPAPTKKPRAARSAARR